MLRQGLLGKALGKMLRQGLLVNALGKMLRQARGKKSYGYQPSWYPIFRAAGSSTFFSEKA